jgi:hypothetical protein
MYRLIHIYIYIHIHIYIYTTIYIYICSMESITLTEPTLKCSSCCVVRSVGLFGDTGKGARFKTCDNCIHSKNKSRDKASAKLGEPVVSEPVVSEPAVSEPIEETQVCFCTSSKNAGEQE